MMSAKQRIRTLGVLFPALLLSVQAFGWGGSTHSALTTRVFDDSAVAPLLGGINQGAIENWTGEPPSALSQWASIRDRYYVESAGDEPGGYDWWDDWDETTRLKYLTHSAADCAVPVGHSPANSVYDNQLAEGSLELLVNGWSSYPDITDSGWFKHPKTKRWMKLDGKISHVMDEFEDGVIDNAAWFKSTGWYGIHTPSELEDAGSYGTSMAMMIMRVVLVDYFLSKE
ncbi:MAG: hypothetical protein JXA11_09890, partial [Phycisphaerae bacterium]|nr:hypothetical protein [Phycisphaerae bacterium]